MKAASADTQYNTTFSNGVHLEFTFTGQNEIAIAGTGKGGVGEWRVQ